MHSSYDQIAEQWHANPRGQSYVERILSYVNKLISGIPAGRKVLDLGCGTGEPIAKHLLRKGFRVVGVDQSQKMLEIAKELAPQAEFIHSDMIDIEFHEEFAAAVAWDSMFHVPRKFHGAIFKKLAAALKPGGRLLVSAGGSDVDPSDPAATADGEGFTSEMYGHTFFYSGYDPAVTRKLIEAAGFEIELWEVDDPTSRGHIAVIARRLEAGAIHDHREGEE